jgi:hypothetical protein
MKELEELRAQKDAADVSKASCNSLPHLAFSNNEWPSPEKRLNARRSSRALRIISNVPSFP